MSWKAKAGLGAAAALGLGLMVEILSGVVVGAGVARDVGSLFSTWDRSIDAGHVFNRHRPGAIHPAPDVSRARRGAAGVGAGGSSSGGGRSHPLPRGDPSVLRRG